jgi:radical SAM superfamily enzyme YgiQ (UPF0313 family)
MRILFVKPQFNNYAFVQHFMVCEPLEFEMLAAAVGGAHDVRVVDLRVDPVSLEAHLEEYEPDVVGFTALTMDVNTVLGLARRVKSHHPEIVTCVGGEHASFRPEDFGAPSIDFVFQYDALSTFPRLLPEIERIRRTFGRASRLHEHLPRLQRNQSVNDAASTTLMPRRDLCDRYLPKYIYGCANPVNLIQTTAGCPFRCTYCSIPSRQLRYVRRDVEAVLEDMAATKATDLLSIDANALQDVKGSLVLYEEIARAKLKKRLMISCRTDTIVRHTELLEVLKRAGVSVIAFGIENFDDQTLADYEKKNTAENNRRAVELVHEHGMLVRANFIVEQRFVADDFRRLVDHILRLRIEFPTFQILTPLPGTKFFDEKKGDILTTNLDYFDLSHTVLPTRLPTEDFYKEFQRLFRVCYGPKRLLWLTSRLPLVPAVRGVTVALRSHLGFSYRTQPTEA